MKRFLLFLLVFISLSVNASVNDSLKIVTLQREVINLKASVSRLMQENGKIQGLYQQQKANVDSLQNKQEKQYENLSALADKIGADLSETNNNLQTSTNNLSNSINYRTWFGILGLLIALALLGVAYSILRKKISSGNTTIGKIKSAQEGLEQAQKAMQEESVKLDSKLLELLDKKIETVPTSNINEQTDHTLALKVADEIVRIETNLSRMDTSVKGYKQLAKAVERIRTNFLANGYEIVEMLGKPYNEGMKVVANFVSDDTLAEGEQKITGIIKPQINYKGKMIQSAQITVSQNL